MLVALAIAWYLLPVNNWLDALRGWIVEFRCKIKEGWRRS